MAETFFNYCSEDFEFQNKMKPARCVRKKKKEARFALDFSRVVQRG